MSFLFPDGTYWGVASWVSRGFFADAKEFLLEAPALADDVMFCIEADVDTIDLRAADQEALIQLLALVDRVLAVNRIAGPGGFRDPEACDVYLKLLEELRRTLTSLVTKT